MYHKIFKLILLIFLVLPFDLYSQDSLFIAYLKDKNPSKYSIDKPSEFLSEQAIKRRKKQKIKINNQDLPVSYFYLDSLKKSNIKVLSTSKWLNAALIKTSGAKIQELKKCNFVINVEYVAPYIHQEENTNLPDNLESWNKFLTSEATLFQNDHLNISKFHEKGYKGEGITIAVFDEGFLGVDSISYFKHLFRENRIISTRNFLKEKSKTVFHSSDHGTKVFSTIGALEKELYVGGAHNSNFILCITENGSPDFEYKVEEFYWLLAAEYTDSLGVDIINSSVGYSTFKDPLMNYSSNSLNGETSIISRAANIASSKGIIVVTSAGNLGNNVWKYITFPSDSKEVVAVGALNKDMQKASFSSQGLPTSEIIKPDVVALGVEVAVIDKHGIISDNGNGTSFSAPLITSLISCYWQANPLLSSKEVIHRIKSSARNASTPNLEIGYGIPMLELKKVEDKDKKGFLHMTNKKRKPINITKSQ